ncbi:hypothetical protein V496_08615 [Pseudogymnoascus sp. VKM F-4515 (FW-2607)]|nr:hypothetical protein V496_08615 [Pseudogymnoascus sp. VKM F-4515 (FW-2607)]KFY78314.1 hypothetical protein V498_09157 [Pseudogymnoascus sp. VKM F-4517 (FW-2822)]
MAPQAPRQRHTSVIELASDFSDGGSEYWPGESGYVFKPNDDYYHRSLASQWMESIGESRKDTTYILSALPKDYRIYTKTRKNGTHVDRYLFGHPKGKFDSPIKFFVHFQHLMNGGEAECECVNCKSNKSYQKPDGQRLPGRKPQALAVDVLDINPAQKYIDLLYRSHNMKARNLALSLDFDYNEPMGWSYRLFNPHVEYVSVLHDCHSFQPRENEIVLFYSGESTVRMDESTQYLKLFDESTGKFGGWPKWEAGRVVSAPESGQTDLKDLAFSTLKGKTISTPSISIEVLPSDSLSQLTPTKLDVELSHIRPFSMLRELQHGQDQTLWENNIMPTAHMMCKLYPFDPYAFTRIFPSPGLQGAASDTLNAKFRCRGIWLGAEKIIEGDAVRLMPLDDQGVIDHVLVVKEISYVLEHLEAESPTGNLFFEGRCLTLTQPSPKSKAVVRPNSTYAELTSHGLPSCMRGYTWYDSEDPEMNGIFPPDRILGRCYEREAMELMIYASDLNIGLEGVGELRRWAMSQQNNNVLGWIWPEDYPGTESHVKLHELRVGKHRAAENNVSFGSNPIGSLNRPGYKNPHDFDNFGSEVGSGALEKMSTISASVTQDDKEDEADMFIREALEGSFADDSSEINHVAKKLRI